MSNKYPISMFVIIGVILLVWSMVCAFVLKDYERAIYFAILSLIQFEGNKLQ